MKKADINLSDIARLYLVYRKLKLGLIVMIILLKAH
jgi:hypothetical protein